MDSYCSTKSGFLASRYHPELVPYLSEKNKKIVLGEQRRKCPLRKEKKQTGKKKEGRNKEGKKKRRNDGRKEAIEEGRRK